MNAKLPKHHVVMRRIMELISTLEPGAAVPTERDLAARFDTSRTTVRQALASLAADGRVVRTQGSGTFVAEPNRVFVHQLTSYTEDLKAQGHAPESQFVDVAQVKPAPEVAAALRVKSGKVYRVERVRLVDRMPLAFETAYLAGKLPRLRQELDRHRSLYKVLRDVYGIELARAEDVVECALAAPDEGALLGVDPGSPLLITHRTAYGPDDIPIEFTRSAFRGDRFRFVASSSF